MLPVNNAALPTSSSLALDNNRVRWTSRLDVGWPRGQTPLTSPALNLLWTITFFSVARCEETDYWL